MIVKSPDSWRSTKEYRDWQASVFIRDQFKCVKCGSQDGIVSDHLKSANLYPHLRFEVSNGRTLCYSCHFKFGEKSSKCGGELKNLASSFSETRMQLTGAGGETTRTSIPYWVVGLMLNGMGIERISAREFASNFRIHWEWTDNSIGAHALFIPNK